MFHRPWHRYWMPMSCSTALKSLTSMLNVLATCVAVSVSSASSFIALSALPMMQSAMARIFFGSGSILTSRAVSRSRSSSSHLNTNRARASSLNFVAM